MVDPYFTFGYSIMELIVRLLNYLKLHFALLPPWINF